MEIINRKIFSIILLSKKIVVNSIKRIVLLFISESLLLKLFQYKWKKNNSHNKVRPIRIFPIESVSVGKGTYGDLNVFSLSKGNYLRIGNYCSIAEEVTFLLNIDHNYKKISTYPFGTFNHREGIEVVNDGDIIIDDDVWIGYRSTIMSGVHIGQGAIVGAGSIVTNDIPPYCIACGVPARVIKKRFSDKIIEALLSVDYSSVNKHSNILDCEVTEENYYTIVQSLKL